MVDARQVVNYNNNKYGLLHTIRIALSQRLICRFESCPDFKNKNYEKRKILEWIYIRFLYWWNNRNIHIKFNYKRNIIKNSQVAEW